MMEVADYRAALYAALCAKLSGKAVYGGMALPCGVIRRAVCQESPPYTGNPFLTQCGV